MTSNRPRRILTGHLHSQLIDMRPKYFPILTIVRALHNSFTFFDAPIMQHHYTGNLQANFIYYYFNRWLDNGTSPA